MFLLRATRVLVFLLAAMGEARATQEASDGAQSSSSGIHDFDFLVGEWRVHHRRISARTKQWVEFEGTCSHRLLMAGAANIEEHAMNSPDGPYRAAGLRAFDAKSGTWSIWWLDGRYPQSLGAPVRGRFANGEGKFYSDYVQDGKPMRGRFIWSDITPTSARWQQATSADGGATWDTNWTMQLQRVSELPAQPAASVAGSDQFGFLDGEWQVQHRYLRVTPNGHEWVAADGTVSHRELRNGWANVEDYVITTSAGVNRAAALRCYDATTGQWSIWWLDGRDPMSIDTPMRGRFENGVGTFDGETLLNGKPVRVRFQWADIASTSPRWQQSYSYDAGKSWELVWIMQFRRAPNS